MNTTPKKDGGTSKSPSVTPKRKTTPARTPKKTVIGAAQNTKKEQATSPRRNSSASRSTERPVQKAADSNVTYESYYREAPKKNKDVFGFRFGMNKETVILGIIAALIVANIIAITGITQRSIPERLTADQVANASKIDLEKMFESPFTDVRVHSSDYKKGTLVLINDTYAIDSDSTGRDIADPEIVKVNRYINDKNFKARDNTTQLSLDTVDALNLMFADFTAQGGRRDVMVNEAYRSYEDQKSIYDAKVKSLGQDQTIAQRPGYSEHHTGYAVDFSIYPDGGKGARTFTREEDYLWIYDNCHKYGFILRYPENKTHITGISPESWHFRYVGVPHASYMYEKGITLEEYLSEIRIYTENVPLVFKANGIEYGVYYVKSGVGEYTDFKAPKDTEYLISGDNVGGFVVWYRTGNESIDEDNATPANVNTIPQTAS